MGPPDECVHMNQEPAHTSKLRELQVLLSTVASVFCIREKSAVALSERTDDHLPRHKPSQPGAGQ